MESENLLKDVGVLPAGARVCLYGSGRGANLFMAHLRARRRDVTVVCLMDTFKRGTKDGLPVIGPGDYAHTQVWKNDRENDRENDIAFEFKSDLKSDTNFDLKFDLIIVASQYRQEITETLRQWGIDNYLVADMNLLTGTTVEGPQSGLRHPVYVKLLGELWQKGDDDAWLAGEFRRLEEDGRFLDRYATLTHLLEIHPYPHHVNALLCTWEMENSIETVRSFPINLGMDITNMCNVRCRFCKYTDGLFPADTVTLAYVRRIEWFRYLSGFGFGGGTAESLVNPGFVDIFNYIREGFPHLYINIFTNGVALTPEVLHVLAGRLDHLHVSMNASNEEDYGRVVARGNWKRFSANMKSMAEILRGHSRPVVTSSFVMIRSNVQRAVEFVEFAHAHGASRVTLNHYLSGINERYYGAETATMEEKLKKTDSLYYDRERANEYFAMALERGRELGIEVDVPVPFPSRKAYEAPQAHKESQISPAPQESRASKAHREQELQAHREAPLSWITFANRSVSPPPAVCFAPWSHMFLRWGIRSVRPEVWFCCGSAVDTGIYYDKDEALSASGLLRIRNHPSLRAFRRTVNPPVVNPVCAHCRRVDRFDPDDDFPPDQGAFYDFNCLPMPDHLQRPTRIQQRRREP
ncbi:MAG: radical SAM protein [Nitrospirae bacterium]|nr:radical SAM protein [Nitrospirota bacterium]